MDSFSIWIFHQLNLLPLLRNLPYNKNFLSSTKCLFELDPHTLLYFPIKFSNILPFPPHLSRLPGLLPCHRKPGLTYLKIPPLYLIHPIIYITFCILHLILYKRIYCPRNPSPSYTMTFNQMHYAPAYSTICNIPRYAKYFIQVHYLIYPGTLCNLSRYTM